MKTKMEKEQDISVAEVLAAGQNNSSLPEKEPEQMWTLEDAFDGLCDPRESPTPTGIGIINDTSREELNLERGIRSVAFLLSYVSEDGNAKVDGFIAEGLGLCLKFCAKESVRLLSFHRRRKQ
jgi:hypothetical protein